MSSHYTRFSQATGRTFCFKDLLLWPKDVATGMEFLASVGVVHRDLAARNILLTRERRAKISDFGLARFLYGNPAYEQQTTELKLPCRWMALECFTGMFSTNSDVWAYGVLVWEIFSLGELPYTDVEFTDVAQFVGFLRDGMRISQRHHTTPEIFAKLGQCWREEPWARPLFAELKDFFSNLHNLELQI